MTIEVKINTKRLEKILKTSPEELNRVMPGVAFRIGDRFLGSFYAARLRGPPGVRGTRKGLRSQFKIDVRGTKFDNLRLKVFTRSPIARLHERGGTTKARRGKYLAVPLSDLSKSEVKTAKRLLSQTGEVLRARSEGIVLRKKGRKVKSLEVFVVESKRNNTRFLARRVGNTLKVLFHLQKRVVNKPLLGFRDSWLRYRPKAIREINRGIGFALAAARKKAGAA